MSVCVALAFGNLRVTVTEQSGSTLKFQCLQFWCWLDIRPKWEKLKNKIIAKFQISSCYRSWLVKLAPACLFHLVCFSNMLEAQDTVRVQRGEGVERNTVNISISNRGYYTLYVVYLNWNSLKDILKQIWRLILNLMPQHTVISKQRYTVCVFFSVELFLWPELCSHLAIPELSREPAVFMKEGLFFLFHVWQPSNVFSAQPTSPLIFGINAASFRSPYCFFR